MSPSSESGSSTSTSKFATQTYVFDPRPAFPLQIVAKRYSRVQIAPGGSSSTTTTRTHAGGDVDVDAPTLVFTHGTGFHKELWEPVMDDLAGLVEGQGKGKVRIGDIWAVDCPNHGDSAALNEEALGHGYEYIFNWEEYGRVLHLFVNGLGRLRQIGGFGDGPGVYPFAARSVIGVGHSMGGVALLRLTSSSFLPYSLPPFIDTYNDDDSAMSLTYAPSPTYSFAPPPAHPIKSLILVEPMILPPSYALGESARLVAGADKRKDRWTSRREAREAMGRSLGRQGWEERCVRLYSEYGVAPVERGAEDGSSITGMERENVPVTLKCTKVQEAACYRDPLGPTRLYPSFGALVQSLPVHVMYGAVDDYLPVAVKTDIIENKAGGVQNLASYTRVPGGGHLVPFQSPTALAEKIFDALGIQAHADAQERRERGAGKAKL